MIGEAKMTNRGFDLVEFKDKYGYECSLQESSLAVCEDADGKVADPLGYLWLGISDAKPQIMKSDARRLGIPYEPDEDGHNGWTAFPIPKEVLLTTRMHLNEHQVRSLMARLQLWLDTGSILTFEETKRIHDSGLQMLAAEIRSQEAEG